MMTPGVIVMDDKPPTLEEAQAIVGGLVELVRLDEGQLLVNEEGRLLGMTPNPTASVLARRLIVGPALLLQGKARWT